MGADGAVLSSFLALAILHGHCLGFYYLILKERHIRHDSQVNSCLSFD